MKTAISVPDDTFAEATRRAHDLGMSRSEFFSRAARSYLNELDAESTTRQVDAALEQLPQLDESTIEAVDAGQHLLAGIDDEW